MRIVRTQWSQMARTEQIMSGATVASLLLLALGAVGMALRNRPIWGKVTICIASAGLALSLSGCSLNQRPEQLPPQPQPPPVEPTVKHAVYQAIVQELNNVRGELAQAQTRVQQLSAPDIRNGMIERRNALLDAWIAAAGSGDQPVDVQRMMQEYEAMLEADKWELRQADDRLRTIIRQMGS